MSDRTSSGAKTLPRRFYASPTVFQEEIDKIFSRRWLFVGHESEVSAPGSFLRTRVADEQIVIVRDREGQVRAFYNVCRHRGAQFCVEERGELASGFQCPYHAWTYGLDGSLIGAPNMDEVEGFRREDQALHPVATQVWEGLIFVNLAARPEPFDDAFAPLLGKFDQWHIAALTRAHRTVYDVRANWKLLFQNYSECYHCPTVHPMLNKLTPYRNSANDLDEGPFLGGPMKMAMSEGSMTMTGRRCGSPLGGVEGDDLSLVYYYTIFPNLFLSLHPDYVLIHRGEAIACDHTRIVCEWYFHPDDIAREDFDPAPAVEFWDMTNREDWHLCTISQQGISSRAYSPGPYSNLESQLAAFDREYLRALGVDSEKGT
jgi:Rieske 2Fe-2S family protein